MILPSEWLPIIWGDDEPDFADISEAQTILNTIMARFNEIIANLDAGPDAFDPVFLEGLTGQVIVTDWPQNFWTRSDCGRRHGNRWLFIQKHGR